MTRPDAQRDGERSQRVAVARAALGGEVARGLIAALDRELLARYPNAGADHFRVDEREVAPGRGVFLIASLDGAPAGCGALRRLDAETAEVKRMYVAPAARRRGVGRALLDALLAEARALGARRVVLETGALLPEALALYERAGFVRTGAPGQQGPPTCSLSLVLDL